MKIYLVGGAVRDKLLGLPVKEKDWVVVGATVSEMLAQGFRQVGKDFPVFLHPKTNEEYALARKERKVGRGYKGFDFDASATVTLAEDLLRRDLTINAIAETAEGKLIDPYAGKNDIEKKLLRHVSHAFVEDPVRILRVARFSARFVSLGFIVAPETIELMQTMVRNGEVNELVPERVFKELEKALQETNPEEFFKVLHSCGALEKLFAGLDLHSKSFQFLQKAAFLKKPVLIRFAVLFESLPIAELKKMCNQYRVPNAFADLTIQFCMRKEQFQNLKNAPSEAILLFLEQMDVYRRSERFKNFLTVAEICLEQKTLAENLEKFYEATKKIDSKSLIERGLQGKQISDQIHQQRLEIIKKML